MTEMTPKHPEIEVKLSGMDGNVFVLLGACRRAMQRAGVPGAEVQEFTDEVAASHSYDEALQTMMRWVEVI